MQNIIRAFKIQAVRNFWNHSIQRQLVLGIALVHAVLMTIFVSDLVSRQHNFLNKQSIEQTEALARSLAANSVSWVLANDVIGLEEIVASQNNYPNLAYAMILSPRGKVLSHTDNSLVGLYVQDKISLGLLKDEPDIKNLVNDIDLIDIGVPIFSGHQVIGWSRVAISKQLLHSGLRKILRDGIGYTILAILAGSIFAIAMARGITSGIRQLLYVTHRVENGHIESRVENERPDELGQLGNSFNHMIDRIEKSMGDLKKSQQLALEEKKKAQIYLNTAMVAFLVLDLKGQVLLANPHCLNILQYKETQILGKNWFKTCIPEQDRMDENQKYSDWLQTMDSSGFSFESMVLTKSHEVRVMDWRNTHLYDPNGKVVGMLLSGIDITEKKKNENELNKYRNHLEDLVTHRTKELETAKDSLEQEIEEHKASEIEREKLIIKLQKALEEIKTLSGIVPICSQCKKIRDDKGYWNLIETYIEKHSEASFSHGMCPECSEKLYGREDWYIKMQKEKKNT